MSNSTKTRDSALNAIKRYMAKSIDEAFTMDAENIASYLQLLSEQWVRFNVAQDAVEITCGADVIEIEENVRIQAETWYSTASANFSRVKNCRTNSQDSSTKASVSTVIRLPKMELPTFSGDSTEWIGFFDAFSSLVDNNSALTDGQKLHYLRSCLKGDALKIISGFKICDANYVEAWGLLTSRYKVIRVIVESHLRALAEIKRATHDNADAIKGVIDAFQQHIRELKALGRPIEFWDDWLVHEVVSKLAFETRKQWELSLVSDDPPSFEQLITFLEIRCRSLSMFSSSTTSVPIKVKTASSSKSTNVFHTISKQSNVCAYCSGPHKIYSCEKFRELDLSTKSQFVKQGHICFNCLSSGHYKDRCNSASTCRMCKQRHHTLLHGALQSTTVTAVNNYATHSLCAADATSKVSAKTCEFPASVDVPRVSSCLNSSSNPPIAVERVVLLSTALVKVRDCSGNWQPARALFDSGSHASFVTEACVQRLGLPRSTSEVNITGIGSAQGGRARGEVSLSLSSFSTNQCFTVKTLILSKITSDLPTQTIATSSWPHIRGLFLADPHFMKPGRVDILIGMDVMDQLICTELRKGPSGAPMAQLTVFGWTLFGSVNGSEPDMPRLQSLHCDVHLDRALNKLWELEEGTQKTFLTHEERYCEDHFETTHRREPNGRFVVELPLKPDVALGESRNFAIRNLLRLERRLACDSDLRLRYNEFMNELIDMKHMQVASETMNPTYYMPHHPVLKESSTTTKLRVVFNASAKSTSGNSLNDALFIGPQLQEDLYSILLRFRTHRYAVTADVAKMYRQICVSLKHADLQRIVWRSHPSLPIQDFRMVRVTYGVAAASHLAVRSLQQTARDSSNDCARAVSVILKDFYMDDLLTGASSKEELRLLQQNISEILREGGFELRKWASNCAELIASISNASTNISHYIVDDKDVHALGLIWNTEGDYLTFAINLREPPVKLTKRMFLSDASTLFDPLGLLAPATINSKIWFQDIWRTKVGWDDIIPESIATKWLEHRIELKKLAHLKVKRWFGTEVAGSFTQLHVFADASERAYAAVLYARTTQSDGSIIVSLISSKTKVAPLKPTTLPRLELCAAHLAAKLVRSVLHCWSDLRYPLFAWTDSTITLAWLQAHPSRWVTFIANRVADIQEVLPPECWNHVRSEQNPADCASRGITPSELLRHQLWWAGPIFLKSTEQLWKQKKSKEHTTELGIRKSIRAHVINSTDHWSVMTKYSSYSKLRRVISYVLRFLTNIRANRRLNVIKRFGTPSCQELFEAELRLISAKRPIPLRSSLLRLQPFLDGTCVLRVGGRIKNDEIAPDVRHPIILPKNCPLAKLIICEIHKVTLHAGPRIMQTVLQRRYWVIGARSLIRNIYHKCVKCTYLNRNLTTQVMGDLPVIRTTYARCFTHTAVDFAGPYLYKFTQGRGAKATKGYICSFICMCTGAMHLEFVGDLSTPAFLNAFKRFTNRRGFCKVMASDNGTNFVGAEKELRIAFQQCMADIKLRSFFADSNIEWRFNPPAAPHMGGYWETGVKRVKYHLKRVLGEVPLSYEEFNTLLTEIEACVNSRPLCDNSEAAGDLEVLTPGHFIVGEPLKSIPEPEGQGFRGNLRQRWQAISAMRQHFWRRWRDEYLVSLQRRTKWFRSSRNIEEGDVVAVFNEPNPPTKWTIARVIKCHHGTDGRVRVVTLKTPHGELVRPIVKLCLLPTRGDLFHEETNNLS
ncbi:uncharacterized protein LOC129238173 [Anastrepha obliqua]|uniref:uncharacterized protein LOC129238173 n=2 Tax=Anastrepha obliqua TaxID=95512 RepID=UPI00240966A0|nr:uncharacterized protein LOC129238173 [Anastrepha obliqua]